jgi:uncharacterized caspase-like protein
VKRKFLPPLLALSLLSAASLLPPAALTQQRAAATQAGAGGYHALVIGNNDYKSLPKLKTAEADAREVASLLKEFYGFETRLLLNATRQQTVSALYSYRQALGPEAKLLVYYAGHGINDREADKSYWLPVDAARDDDSNWISADDITTRLRAIPARHVLVISDSCYSGTLTRGIGEALPPPNAREHFLQRMMAGRARTLMASGGNEPVADSGGGRHSVFASALLRGLREMDKDKFTAAELFRHYVQEPVAGRAQQTPEYNPLRNSGHESGDFVFVRVKTDGKDVEVTINTPSAAVNPLTVELSYWDTIRSSSDPEDFNAYLKRYPNGQFAELARNRVRALNNSRTAAGGPASAPKPIAGAWLVPEAKGDPNCLDEPCKVIRRVVAAALTNFKPIIDSEDKYSDGSYNTHLSGGVLPDFTSLSCKVFPQREGLAPPFYSCQYAGDREAFRANYEKYLAALGRALPGWFFASHRAGLGENTLEVTTAGPKECTLETCPVRLRLLDRKWPYGRLAFEVVAPHDKPEEVLSESFKKQFLEDINAMFEAAASDFRTVSEKDKFFVKHSFKCIIFSGMASLSCDIEHLPMGRGEKLFELAKQAIRQHKASWKIEEYTRHEGPMFYAFPPECQATLCGVRTGWEYDTLVGVRFRFSIQPPPPAKR